MREVYVAFDHLSASGARVARSVQSDAAHRLLDDLLLTATGRSWTLGHDQDGRPRLEGAGPEVSLSHSGRWVAAAVAQERVGIDIEAHRPGRDRSAIARRWFSAEEQALVARDGEPALLACWTLREAYSKAAGGGVATALAVDGRLLLPALGGAATVEIDGCRWAIAQAGSSEFQAALAWQDGDEAKIAAAMLRSSDFPRP